MEFGMKDAIAKITDGKNLTETEAKQVMEIMLSGEATQAQLGAVLNEGRDTGGINWICIGASGKGGYNSSKG